MKYKITYYEKRLSSIEIEAASEEEALEKAEEAWCDFEEDQWEEESNVTDVQISKIKKQ